MIIEKIGSRLSVTSSIHVDDNSYFCGRPYIYLQAFHKSPFSWIEDYSIIIGIHDNDDFDISLKYNPTSENFADVLHELINWMIDHEKGVASYSNIWNDLEFFPYCECKVRRW